MRARSGNARCDHSIASYGGASGSSRFTLGHYYALVAQDKAPPAFALLEGAAPRRRSRAERCSHHPTGDDGIRQRSDHPRPGDVQCPLALMPPPMSAEENFDSQHTPVEEFVSCTRIPSIPVTGSTGSPSASPFPLRMILDFVGAPRLSRMRLMPSWAAAGSRYLYPTSPVGAHKLASAGTS